MYYPGVTFNRHCPEDQRLKKTNNVEPLRTGLMQCYTSRAPPKDGGNENNPRAQNSLPLSFPYYAPVVAFGSSSAVVASSCADGGSAGTGVRSRIALRPLER